MITEAGADTRVAGLIQPDLERKFAKAMNATTITVPSSHVPMLSHPAEVAKLIIAAARNASKQQ